MSQVFLIADTHFGDQKIIEYENRPFANVQVMDQTIIRNWNHAVKSNDKVYILGDFAFASKERIKEIIAQLNGYKVLVLGNHDRMYPYTWWAVSGLDEVLCYPIIYEEWFILSHEPLYMNSNMPYANIYGHVHGNPLYKDYSTQGYCACVERINYTPIAFEEVSKWIKNS